MQKKEFNHIAIEGNLNVSPRMLVALESIYQQALEKDEPFHKLKEIKSRIRLLKMLFSDSEGELAC